MKRYLYLPKQYDTVVGEPFELFYRGIVNSVSIDTYDFELSYSDGKNRGKGFARKYYFTPTEEDLGLHTLKLRLRDNEGEILDEADFPANNRNPKPLTLGSNGLHLTPAGYLQIADAIYRHLAARWS